MRGHSDYSVPTCDIFNDDRPGPDDSVVTDRYALAYGRTGTDVRSLTHMNSAAKLRSGSQMNMITNTAVMLHDGSSVNQHVDAELRPRVNEGSRTELTTRTAAPAIHAATPEEPRATRSARTSSSTKSAP